MLLLIGGHVRSGTTLLRDLCNSHPGVAITNEFNCLLGLGETYTEHSRLTIENMWRRTLGSRRNRLKLKRHLRSGAFLARYLYDVRRHMRMHQDRHVEAVDIEWALRSAFPKARIVGDKSPRYVFDLDKFVAIEGLRCLVIFRDCRDVVSSTLEIVRAEWHEQHWSQIVDTAEKVATRWVRCVEIMERYKDEIYMIRYEDLVRVTRQELAALARWLGVESYGFPESVISGIRDVSVGKYRERLTEGELKTVTEIAGPTMTRLGYS